MNHSLEPDKIEEKFAFFRKKINKQKNKMKLKDKIALSFLAVLLVSVQISSIDHFKTISIQFQQKNVVSYQPATLSSDFVKANSNELLVSYLTQKVVDYKDIDNSIEILKANKKIIPNYLFTATLSKIKGDNISLYTQKNRELRQEYSSIRNFGLGKNFVNNNIPQQNYQKFLISNKIYINNFDQLENKINTYFPKNSKDIKAIEPKLKTPDKSTKSEGKT